MRQRKIFDKSYGLILDNTREKAVASIASVGFGLSGIPIGIEHGWITKAEGRERAKRTLETFLNNVEQKEGFFIY